MTAEQKPETLFIKNPNREIAQKKQFEQVIPEYKRKEIEPLRFEHSQDFEIKHQKTKMAKEQKGMYVPTKDQSWNDESENKKEYNFDEIPDPPIKSVVKKEVKVSGETAELPLGEYAILVENEVLFHSALKQEAEEFLTELLVNNEAISPIVLYRLNIKIGATFG